ncbi:proton-coupled folate transporter [Esox lucius]|uniref:Major facilitator superfamily (MFS) profile domain-containing protein n=1 Tax=Esox lucius TaxID=8010 RepID=A0A6Q2ZKJ5_ESOLU|nr:proton-coupled folate transporter [Esox lucius]
MSAWGQWIRTFVTVEPVIFLYMTSTFIMTPTFQQLVITKVCYELFRDTDICRSPERYKDSEELIEDRSSFLLLLFTCVTSLVSIPPALLLGSWSDRSSRKAVMLLPCLTSLVSGGVFIALSLLEDASVYWLLATAVVTGLSGGYVSLFLSSFSFLADATAGLGSNRTLRMAVAESMVFVGGAVGFLLGGLLIQEFGVTSAFMAYSSCHVLSVLYILLWLRNPERSAPPTLSGDDGEGLPPVAGDAEAEPSANLMCLSDVKRSFHSVFRRRPGQQRLKLHLLIVCTFINNMVAVGEQAISLLYLMYKPREFTTEMYGVFKSTQMLLLGLTLLVIFPLLMRVVGVMTLGKVSVLFRTAGFVLMAFSTNTWMVFLVSLVSAPAGITQAVVRSLSSNVVDPDEQGAMFSFSASVETTCYMFAAVLFNGLYPLTLPTFPGMPFIAMAGFTLIVFILMQWISEMPATQARLIIQD